MTSPRTVEDHLSVMSGTHLPIDFEFQSETISEESWDLFISDLKLAGNPEGLRTTSLSGSSNVVGGSSENTVASAETLAHALEVAFPCFLGLVLTRPLRLTDHP